MLKLMCYLFTISICSIALSLNCQGQFVVGQSFLGDSSGDTLGQTVGNAGDVNGDGFDDIVAGASGASFMGNTDAGMGRVYSGADGSILFTVFGNAMNAGLGLAASGAGDVNGDGFDDVVFGAPGGGLGGILAGYCIVVSGVDGSTLFTFQGAPGDRLGASVSGAGDVNNDGFADILVGSPTAQTSGIQFGNVKVFSGQDGSLLYLIGNTTVPYGDAVSDVGDVNGDGYDDFVLGSAGDSTSTPGFAGSARIFSGINGSVLYQFSGDSVGDNFGTSVRGAGDVDGDGIPDVVVGAPLDGLSGPQSGSISVFSGFDGHRIYLFAGDNPGDNFGLTVSGAGDINGDGFDDVLAGAPFASNNGNSSSGRVRVFSGLDGKVLGTLNGDSSGEQFGRWVSGGGDTNGDGLDDIIVGSPLDSVSFPFAGSAHVYLGFMGSVMATSSFGFAASDRYGTSVKGAGDVNGDGFADIIVGAPFDDTAFPQAGAARVISGFDQSVIHTFFGSAAEDLFGVSVSGVGDVNGDGFADVLVGAIGNDANGSNAGSARVFSGVDGSVLFVLLGDSAEDRFGVSVSGAGDVDQDGSPDFIIGAFRDDNNGLNSGMARVFSGATGGVLYTFDGDSSLDLFGNSVSDAGDVNGDGFDDVIVGAVRDDNNGPESGSARVFSGFDGTILYTLNGDSTGDSFGSSVSGAGDVNGDGFADLIVGAFADDINGVASGSARVFSGVDGSVLATRSGDSPNDGFGNSVSGPGDVNGDGFDDLLVGAAGVGVNGANAGRVFLYSGMDGSTLRVFDGCNALDSFGFSVSGAGDVNGDGFVDLVVGAPGASPNGANSGTATIILSEVFPILSYSSDLGQTRLTLRWTPGGGDPFATSGTMTCFGATPGALGLIGISFAPANSLLLGFPLLLANDPVNLISLGGFGFDILGQFIVQNVSRQSPGLGGVHVFIQMYESSPLPSASNGIRMLLTP